MTTLRSQVLSYLNMPILEVLQVRLKDGISAGDPSLLRNLATVRSKIKTNSRFYVSLKNPQLVFILGEWPSLAAHKVFLASAERNDILSPQDEQVEFQWMAHLEFGGMSHLPLEAPVLIISRYVFLNHDSLELCQALDKAETTLQQHTDPLPVIIGWRCDSEPGNNEYFQFSGWEREGMHAIIREVLQESISGVHEDNLKCMEIFEVVDMERGL
ncbi:hypothetical protein PVAG01_06939 [Phlyctema vagabunda]|uniref:Uncharacterized protein n=1 Tax=Phlyctema vagabunda TaxID=108571 RepID=A0ABR4PB29_9HELO